MWMTSNLHQPRVMSLRIGERLASWATSSMFLQMVAIKKPSEAQMRQNGNMYRIGLTGGIAAGKSVVAQRFRELGAFVIDHDVLAREAVAVGSPGLAQIEREFGAKVLLPDGSLNRPALGQIVFGDADALERLNGIVHPAVFALSARAENAARASSKHATVVHDIPLLVETGQEQDFDLLVVVDAPVGLRVERLMEARGLSRFDAEARISSQISDEERLAPADKILDGGGSVENLRRQVDLLWNEIRR